MSDRAITADLLERLRRHYIKPGPMPGWAFVPECGINGGAQTRVDALAVGFTSTSGRILIGHELKASRADWRKELDQAGKADFWADNCHAWYIVAPSTSIVPPEELPHGWGLMVPNPRTTTRMDVKVKALVHADRVPSWVAMRSVLARLDTLRAQHDAEVTHKAVEAARTEAMRLRDLHQQTELPGDARDALEIVKRLSDLLGADVVRWHDDRGISPEVAVAAVKIARAATGVEQARRSEMHSTRHLRVAVGSLLTVLDEYEAGQAELLAALGVAR